MAAKKKTLKEVYETARVKSRDNGSETNMKAFMKARKAYIAHLEQERKKLKK